LGLTISPGGRRYYYNRQLGEGSFGTVYAASSRREQLSASEYVVKEIETEPTERLVRSAGDEPATPYQAYEFTDMYVEREYLVSEVLDRRLGRSFCLRNAVCALERYYRLDQQRGFIVFPYATPRTLGTYLAKFVHSRMQELDRELADKFGERAVTADDLNQLVIQMLPFSKSRATELRRFLKRLRDLQLITLTLALQVCSSVALMHAAHTFHVDIKPENILVVGGESDETRDELRALLIDFGLTCVAELASDRQLSDTERTLLSCDDLYQTTEFFQDPLAVTTRVSDVRNLNQRFFWQLEMYGKYDTYAVGKTLQTIFDPALLTKFGTAAAYPRVRQTRYMPAGVFELIVEMTGEQNFLPPLTGTVRLSDAELEQRQQAFQNRPTMPEVVVQLTNVQSVWLSADNR
jgi:serine/threonine protein kinase